MDEQIDIYAPSSSEDPRSQRPDPHGLRVHRGPALHSDDVTVVNGVPVTSVSRTLIDLAEVLEEGELRECFENARDRGLLDAEALRASRARVEWRASLPLVDRMIAEFTSS